VPGNAAGHLHVPPILAAHIVQRMADLAQRVGLHRFHQRGEDVLAVAGGVLEVGEAVALGVVGVLPLGFEDMLSFDFARRWRATLWTNGVCGSCGVGGVGAVGVGGFAGGGQGVARLLERLHVGDLLALLLLRRADEFDLGGDLAALVLGQEGVDADQGQRAVVFLVLVVQAFFLDLAALVHGVHGAEHAAALADGFEFLVHGLFHQVGEFLDHVAALPGVFVEVEAEFLVDDHLDRHGAAHAFLGGRGDGFVVGVGVQAVAVVEQRVQGLQRGADVVELDFLRVQ